MDILNCKPQNWVENEVAFLKQLEESTTWNSIPLLNVNELHNLKDSTLVRFRGMIQDMHSPEFYLEKFEVIKNDNTTTVWKNGKYCDATVFKEGETVDFNSKSNVTSERHTYVVISVPGINKWVQDVEKSQFKIVQNNPGELNVKNKRTFDEAMDTGCSTEATTSTKVEANSVKKPCSIPTETTSQPSQPSVSKEHILNYPLPDQTGITCHLIIYKDSDDLKLNNMYEFVGFLAMDPIVEAAHEEDNEFENKMEKETLHPPSSLVPRIHCVTYKKLVHNNPLLLIDSDNIHYDRFNIIRKEFLIVLTQLLLGDELAAEYLIFHLLSEVYVRKDFLSLGKFCLNISNVPKIDNLDYVNELYKFIEMFVPKSYYLPMTLENMNELSFVPKKDYDCNRLTSGILQLSQNTHLVLDETKLSDGKLNSSGINAVKAFTDVIRHQKLTYDFNYYQLDYDCDIPFLILSEGKSLLGSDVHVVLKPEQICIDTFAEIVEAAKHFLKPELLNDIRKYLTQSRHIAYTLSEKVEELVENEFVKLRQERNISVDDMHNLLVLARLITISEGKTTMDEECWKKACNLERQRKERLVK